MQLTLGHLVSHSEKDFRAQQRLGVICQGPRDHRAQGHLVSRLEKDFRAQQRLDIICHGPRDHRAQGHLPKYLQIALEGSYYAPSAFHA